VILDINDDPEEADAENEAEGASSDDEIWRIEQDMSVHDNFATTECVSAPKGSIDASGPWYNPEEGRYMEEPAPELGPPQSLSKPSSISDDGWNDENMAELEQELGLALGEQESLSAGTPSSPSPRSGEAPQDEIQSRECSETTDGRLEELQDTSRRGTPAHDLEWWEKRETEVVVEEERAIAMQQQEELPSRKEELVQPVVSDKQNLVKVLNANDAEDRETTKAVPATQPEINEIDKHRFRLRGVRARQLPRR